MKKNNGSDDMDEGWYDTYGQVPDISGKLTMLIQIWKCISKFFILKQSIAKNTLRYFFFYYKYFSVISVFTFRKCGCST